MAFMLNLAGNGQRKNIAMLDSDDDENSSVNSSATIISDRMSMLETEEVQLDKKCVLEQALDDLYEKRFAIYFFLS